MVIYKKAWNFDFQLFLWHNHQLMFVIFRLSKKNRLLLKEVDIKMLLECVEQGQIATTILLINFSYISMVMAQKVFHLQAQQPQYSTLLLTSTDKVSFNDVFSLEETDFLTSKNSLYIAFYNFLITFTFYLIKNLIISLKSITCFLPLQL